jgi:WD40 repeat protein
MSLNDKFKEILIEFLHFFSKNYLLIGNSCSFKIHQHKYCVKSVIFSNDDEYILSCSNDSKIHVYFTRTGKKIHSFSQNTDKVLSLAFSKKQPILASGGKDKSIRIFSLESFEQIKVSL